RARGCGRMRRAITGALAASLACLLASGRLTAQAPVVEKVEPPNWWPGHSINPVRLLIRGRNLAGARVECARLQCNRVNVNPAGTYAFVDVTIPATTTPGAYSLALRTGAGTAPASFSVTAALPHAGRFQGFGPEDVVYLIMPDRFANGDTSNDDPAK